MNKVREIRRELSSMGLLAGDQQIESLASQQGESNPDNALEQFQRITLSRLGELDRESDLLEALSALPELPSRNSPFVENALAWYSGFHQSETGCGVYITVQGLHVIASIIINKHVEDPSKATLEQWTQALMIAWDLLQEHERFHHKYEVAVSTVELLIGKALYVPAAIEGAKFKNPQWRLEEALATSRMLKYNHGATRSLISADMLKSLKAAMNDYVPKLGVGYSDGLKYSSAAPFQQGQTELLADIIGTRLEIHQSLATYARQYKGLFPVDDRVTLVSDRSALSKILRDAHIKMYSPTVSNVGKVLECLGWTRVKPGGKHPHMFESSDGRKFPYGDKKELRNAELDSFVKIIETSRHELPNRVNEILRNCRK